MVSCNAASRATVLSMGSLELLLRASVFTILDLNKVWVVRRCQQCQGRFSGRVCLDW